MKTKQSNYFEKIVKIFITVTMISITALMVFRVASYFYFTHDLPSIETLKNYKPSTITKIFSEEGEVIAEFFYEKREVVSLDRVPNHLIQAFVAGEDARFFQHKALEYLAILRGLVMRRTKFHKTRCAAGLSALRAWQYEYVEVRKQYSKNPLDDWSCDAADAFCEGAKIMRERVIPKREDKRARVLIAGQQDVPDDFAHATLNDMWREHEREARKARI